LPDRTTENASAISIANDSITVTWQHIRSISLALEKFYGYSIQYKVHDKEKTYTEVAIMNYSSQNSLLLNNLSHNVIYDIQIVPFRTDGNLIEYGKQYPIIVAKTHCLRKFRNVAHFNIA